MKKLAIPLCLLLPFLFENFTFSERIPHLLNIFIIIVGLVVIIAIIIFESRLRMKAGKKHFYSLENIKMLDMLHLSESSGKPENDEKNKLWNIIGYRTSGKNIIFLSASCMEYDYLQTEALRIPLDAITKVDIKEIEDIKSICLESNDKELEAYLNKRISSGDCVFAFIDWKSIEGSHTTIFIFHGTNAQTCAYDFKLTLLGRIAPDSILDKNKIKPF